MNKALVGIALALFGCSGGALAAPTSGTDMKIVDLGGVKGMCGLKKSAADDKTSIDGYAKAHDLRIVNFAGMDQKALLGAFNDMPPPTHMTNEIVEAIQVGKAVTMFVFDAGRFCALQPLSAKDFDTMVDKAFGAGT